MNQESGITGMSNGHGRTQIVLSRDPKRNTTMAQLQQVNNKSAGTGGCKSPPILTSSEEISHVAERRLLMGWMHTCLFEMMLKKHGDVLYQLIYVNQLKMIANDGGTLHKSPHTLWQLKDVKMHESHKTAARLEAIKYDVQLYPASMGDFGADAPRPFDKETVKGEWWSVCAVVLPRQEHEQNTTANGRLQAEEQHLEWAEKTPMYASVALEDEQGRAIAGRNVSDDWKLHLSFNGVVQNGQNDSERAALWLRLYWALWDEHFTPLSVPDLQTEMCTVKPQGRTESGQSYFARFEEAVKCEMQLKGKAKPDAEKEKRLVQQCINGLRDDSATDHEGGRVASYRENIQNRYDAVIYNGRTECLKTVEEVIGQEDRKIQEIVNVAMKAKKELSTLAGSKAAVNVLRGMGVIISSGKSGHMVNVRDDDDEDSRAQNPKIKPRDAKRRVLIAANQAKGQMRSPTPPRNADRRNGGRAKVKLYQHNTSANEGASKQSQASVFKQKKPNAAPRNFSQATSEEVTRSTVWRCPLCGPWGKLCKGDGNGCISQMKGTPVVIKGKEMSRDDIRELCKKWKDNANPVVVHKAEKVLNDMARQEKGKGPLTYVEYERSVDPGAFDRVNKLVKSEGHQWNYTWGGRSFQKKKEPVASHHVTMVKSGDAKRDYTAAPPPSWVVNMNEANWDNAQLQELIEVASGLQAATNEMARQMQLSDEQKEALVERCICNVTTHNQEAQRANVAGVSDVKGFDPLGLDEAGQKSASAMVSVRQPTELEKAIQLSSKCIRSVMHAHAQVVSYLVAAKIISEHMTLPMITKDPLEEQEHPKEGVQTVLNGVVATKEADDRNGSSRAQCNANVMDITETMKDMLCSKGRNETGQSVTASVAIHAPSIVNLQVSTSTTSHMTNGNMSVSVDSSRTSPGVQQRQTGCNGAGTSCIRECYICAKERVQTVSQELSRSIAHCLDCRRLICVGHGIIQPGDQLVCLECVQSAEEYEQQRMAQHDKTNRKSDEQSSVDVQPRKQAVVARSVSSAVRQKAEALLQNDRRIHNSGMGAPIVASPGYVKKTVSRIEKFGMGTSDTASYTEIIFLASKISVNKGLSILCKTQNFCNSHQVKLELPTVRVPQVVYGQNRRSAVALTTKKSQSEDVHIREVIASEYAKLTGQRVPAAFVQSIQLGPTRIGSSQIVAVIPNLDNDELDFQQPWCNDPDKVTWSKYEAVQINALACASQTNGARAYAHLWVDHEQRKQAWFRPVIEVLKVAARNLEPEMILRYHPQVNGRPILSIVNSHDWTGELMKALTKSYAIGLKSRSPRVAGSINSMTIDVADRDKLEKLCQKARVNLQQALNMSRRQALNSMTKTRGQGLENQKSGRRPKGQWIGRLAAPTFAGGMSNVAMMKNKFEVLADPQVVQQQGKSTNQPPGSRRVWVPMINKMAKDALDEGKPKYEMSESVKRVKNFSEQQVIKPIKNKRSQRRLKQPVATRGLNHQSCKGYGRQSEGSAGSGILHGTSCNMLQGGLPPGSVSIRADDGPRVQTTHKIDRVIKAAKEMLQKKEDIQIGKGETYRTAAGENKSTGHKDVVMAGKIAREHFDQLMVEAIRAETNGEFHHLKNNTRIVTIVDDRSKAPIFAFMKSSTSLETWRCKTLALDTGSNVCVMPYHVAEEKGLPIYSLPDHFEISMSFSSNGGGWYTVVGMVVNPEDVNNSSIMFIPMILTKYDCSFSLLLSVGVLAELGFHLDLENSCFTMKPRRTLDGEKAKQIEGKLNFTDDAKEHPVWRMARKQQPEAIPLCTYTETIGKKMNARPTLGGFFYARVQEAMRAYGTTSENTNNRPECNVIKCLMQDEHEQHPSPCTPENGSTILQGSIDEAALAAAVQGLHNECAKEEMGLFDAIQAGLVSRETFSQVIRELFVRHDQAWEELERCRPKRPLTVKLGEATIAMCSICKGLDSNAQNILLQCSQCGQAYHQKCLGQNQRPVCWVTTEEGSTSAVKLNWECDACIFFKQWKQHWSRGIISPAMGKDEEMVQKQLKFVSPDAQEENVHGTCAVPKMNPLTRDMNFQVARDDAGQPNLSEMAGAMELINDHYVPSIFQSWEDEENESHQFVCHMMNANVSENTAIIEQNESASEDFRNAVSTALRKLVCTRLLSTQCRSAISGHMLGYQKVVRVLVISRDVQSVINTVGEQPLLLPIAASDMLKLERQANSAQHVTSVFTGMCYPEGFPDQPLAIYSRVVEQIGLETSFLTGKPDFIIWHLMEQSEEDDLNQFNNGVRRSLPSVLIVAGQTLNNAVCELLHDDFNLKITSEEWCAAQFFEAARGSSGQELLCVIQLTGKALEQESPGDLMNLHMLKRLKISTKARNKSFQNHVMQAGLNYGCDMRSLEKAVELLKRDELMSREAWEILLAETARECLVESGIVAGSMALQAKELDQDWKISLARLMHHETDWSCFFNTCVTGSFIMIIAIEEVDVASLQNFVPIQQGECNINPQRSYLPSESSTSHSVTTSIYGLNLSLVSFDQLIKAIIPKTRFQADEKFYESLRRFLREQNDAHCEDLKYLMVKDTIPVNSSKNVFGQHVLQVKSAAKDVQSGEAPAIRKRRKMLEQALFNTDDNRRTLLSNMLSKERNQILEEATDGVSIDVRATFPLTLQGGLPLCSPEVEQLDTLQKDGLSMHDIMATIIIKHWLPELYEWLPTITGARLKSGRVQWSTLAESSTGMAATTQVSFVKLRKPVSVANQSSRLMLTACTPQRDPNGNLPCALTLPPQVLASILQTSQANVQTNSVLEFEQRLQWHEKSLVCILMLPVGLINPGPEEIEAFDNYFRNSESSKVNKSDKLRAKYYTIGRMWHNSEHLDASRINMMWVTLGQLRRALRHKKAELTESVVNSSGTKLTTFNLCIASVPSELRTFLDMADFELQNLKECNNYQWDLSYMVILRIEGAETYPAVKQTMSGALFQSITKVTLKFPDELLKNHLPCNPEDMAVQMMDAVGLHTKMPAESETTPVWKELGERTQEIQESLQKKGCLYDVGVHHDSPISDLTKPTFMTFMVKPWVHSMFNSPGAAKAADNRLNKLTWSANACFMTPSLHSVAVQEKAASMDLEDKLISRPNSTAPQMMDLELQTSPALELSCQDTRNSKRARQSVGDNGCRDLHVYQMYILNCPETTNREVIAYRMRILFQYGVQEEEQDETVRIVMLRDVVEALAWLPRQKPMVCTASMDGSEEWKMLARVYTKDGTPDVQLTRSLWMFPTLCGILREAQEKGSVSMILLVQRKHDHRVLAPKKATILSTEENKCSLRNQAWETLRSQVTKNGDVSEVMQPITFIKAGFTTKHVWYSDESGSMFLFSSMAAVLTDTAHRTSQHVLNAPSGLHCKAARFGSTDGIAIFDLTSPGEEAWLSRTPVTLGIASSNRRPGKWERNANLMGLRPSQCLRSWSVIIKFPDYLNWDGLTRSVVLMKYVSHSVHAGVTYAPLLVTLEAEDRRLSHGIKEFLNLMYPGNTFKVYIFHESKEVLAEWAGLNLLYNNCQENTYDSARDYVLDIKNEVHLSIRNGQYIKKRCSTSGWLEQLIWTEIDALNEKCFIKPSAAVLLLLALDGESEVSHEYDAPQMADVSLANSGLTWSMKCVRSPEMSRRINLLMTKSGQNTSMLIKFAAKKELDLIEKAFLPMHFDRRMVSDIMRVTFQHTIWITEDEWLHAVRNCQLMVDGKFMGVLRADHTHAQILRQIKHLSRNGSVRPVQYILLTTATVNKWAVCDMSNVTWTLPTITNYNKRMFQHWEEIMEFKPSFHGIGWKSEQFHDFSKDELCGWMSDVLGINLAVANNIQWRPHVIDMLDIPEAECSSNYSWKIFVADFDVNQMLANKQVSVGMGSLQWFLPKLVTSSDARKSVILFEHASLVRDGGNYVPVTRREERMGRWYHRNYLRASVIHWGLILDQSGTVLSGHDLNKCLMTVLQPSAIDNDCTYIRYAQATTQHWCLLRDVVSAESTRVACRSGEWKNITIFHTHRAKLTHFFQYVQHMKTRNPLVSHFTSAQILDSLVVLMTEVRLSDGDIVLCLPFCFVNKGTSEPYKKHTPINNSLTCRVKNSMEEVLKLSQGIGNSELDPQVVSKWEAINSVIRQHDVDLDDMELFNGQVDLWSSEAKCLTELVTKDVLWDHDDRTFVRRIDFAYPSPAPVELLNKVMVDTGSNIPRDDVLIHWNLTQGLPRYVSRRLLLCSTTRLAFPLVRHVSNNKHDMEEALRSLVIAQLAANQTRKYQKDALVRDRPSFMLQQDAQLGINNIFSLGSFSRMPRTVSLTAMNARVDELMGNATEDYDLIAAVLGYGTMSYTPTPETTRHKWLRLADVVEAADTQEIQRFAGGNIFNAVANREICTSPMTTSSMQPGGSPRADGDLIMVPLTFAEESGMLRHVWLHKAVLNQQMLAVFRNLLREHEQTREHDDHCLMLLVSLHSERAPIGLFSVATASLCTQQERIHGTGYAKYIISGTQFSRGAMNCRIGMATKAAKDCQHMLISPDEWQNAGVFRTLQGIDVHNYYVILDPDLAASSLTLTRSQFEILSKRKESLLDSIHQVYQLQCAWRQTKALRSLLSENQSARQLLWNNQSTHSIGNGVCSGCQACNHDEHRSMTGARITHQIEAGYSSSRMLLNTDCTSVGMGAVLAPVTIADTGYVRYQLNNSALTVAVNHLSNHGASPRDNAVPAHDCACITKCCNRDGCHLTSPTCDPSLTSHDRITSHDLVHAALAHFAFPRNFLFWVRHYAWLNPATMTSAPPRQCVMSQSCSQSTGVHASCHMTMYEQEVYDSCIDQLQPGGVATPLHDDKHWKDDDTGIIFGGAEEMQGRWDELKQVLQECKEVFAEKLEDLKGYIGGGETCEDLIKFHIPLKDPNAVAWERERKFSPAELSAIDEYITELRDAGIIIKADRHNKFATNLVVAAKRDSETGLWTSHRICQDLRPVNRISQTDFYTPPNLEQLIREVCTYKILATMDLSKAFYQIKVTPQTSELLTFWDGRGQLWSYTRMCFGAKSASAHFQRVIEATLQGLEFCARAYIDDVVIFANTADDFVSAVRQVLTNLMNVGLRVHPGKSVMGAEQLPYLGYLVGRDKLLPQEAKVKAIAELPRPTDKTSLRSFLGVCNYYRGLVGKTAQPCFSQVVKPLNELLRESVKDVAAAWGAQQEEAFLEIKKRLCDPLNAIRPVDYSKPIFLYTDWSTTGIGAILAQIDDEGVECICYAISRSLSPSESNYPSFYGEALALVYAVKTLRHVLHGVKFTVITDHAPIQRLLTATTLTGMHLRWSVALAEFDFDVVHRAGAKHANADILSRNPESRRDHTEACLELGEIQVPLQFRANVLATLLSQNAQHAQHRSYDEAELSILHQVGEGVPELGIKGNRIGPILRHEHLIADVMGQDMLMQHQDYAPHHIEPAWASRIAAEKQWATLVGMDAWRQQGQPMEYTVKSNCQSEIQNEEVTHLTIENVPEQFPEAESLCTDILPAAVWHEAMSQGVVLYEMCGGMATGLQAALRCGWRIRKYLYSDISPEANIAAAKAVGVLSSQYGMLFPSKAWEGMTDLPSDIKEVTPEMLHHQGITKPVRWVVCCGSPCTGFSNAGKRRGLRDSQSKLMFDVVKIISYMQQQAKLKPVYIIENAPIAENNLQEEKGELSTISRVRTMLGKEVLMDAAQLGSRAHRLRSYWLNIVDSEQLSLTMCTVVRDENLTVSQILRNGWKTQAVKLDDKPPYYPCNKAGEEMKALPTFTKTRGSRAFRDKGPGMLIRRIADDETQAYREPDVSEKLAIMGFDANALNHDSISTEKGHELVGNAIDLTALTRLLMLSEVTACIAPTRDTGIEKGQCMNNTIRGSSSDTNDSGRKAAAGRVTEQIVNNPSMLKHWQKVFGITELQKGELKRKKASKLPGKDLRIATSGKLSAAILNGSARTQFHQLRKKLLTDAEPRDYEKAVQGAIRGQSHQGLGSSSIMQENKVADSMVVHKRMSRSPARGDARARSKSPRRSGDAIGAELNKVSVEKREGQRIIYLDGQPMKPLNSNFISRGITFVKPLEQETQTAGGELHGPGQTDGILHHPEVEYKGLEVEVCADGGELACTDLSNYTTAIRRESEKREDSTQAAAGGAASDIFADKIVLKYLMCIKSKGQLAFRRLPKDQQERNRVTKRARHYEWDGRRNKLFRKFPDGSSKEVPRPELRRALVKKVHENLCHFGERRTRQALQQNYWWKGLAEDVQLVIAQCMPCARVKAVFGASSNVKEALKSLPIKGFLYRWSLDYAKPTPKETRSGNQRVLVLLEHYSRFVILVPTQDKEAKTTAEVFTRHVLSVWGAPAEVLTDQGNEFKGRFDELLKQLQIDHRYTHAYSPQGNGATERLVQVVKSALSKLQVQHDIRDNWDEELWKLALSYNSTPQESTQIEPFTLMFAQKATIPEGVRSKLRGEEVQSILEGGQATRQDRLVNDLIRRSRMLAVSHLHAGLNLHVAQHRDYLRYMSLHDKGHPARTTGYKPGEFVMVWQKPSSKLDARAKPTILQVVETLETGIVLLQGADGALVKSQASHLAPCPVQVHPMVDARDRAISVKEACQVCGSAAKAASMLICDECNTGWHLHCLDPPLTEVPEGDWYCPRCSKKRAAPTSKERTERLRMEVNVTEAVSEHTKSKAATLLKLLTHQYGVAMSMSSCEQTVEELDPETGMDRYSEKSQSEDEKEQKALIRKFMADCRLTKHVKVHATASMAVVRAWLWTMVHDKRVPEVWVRGSQETWIVDVASPALMMLLAVAMDNAGLYPYVLALKCQQVTREQEIPSLCCHGTVWESMLTVWALQGRLRLIGAAPHTWTIVASGATAIADLFDSPGKSGLVRLPEGEK